MVLPIARLICVFVCLYVCPVSVSCIGAVCLRFRRGTEPSFSSAPRRVGGSARRGVIDDASEEDGDSQGDYNGTKSVE